MGKYSSEDMKKVYIETMGCQMNKSDSERMFGMLAHFGYEKTEDAKEADLVMVNTCSIRQLSEEKNFKTGFKNRFLWMRCAAENERSFPPRALC